MAVRDQARLRLRVDPVQCDAFGYCAEIVPELIALDDWGFPLMSSRQIDDKSLLQLAKDAMAACPRRALLLEKVSTD